MINVKKSLYPLIFIIIISMISYLYSKELIGRSDDYVYVVADNVNVREQPSINSKIIMKLRIGKLIKILKKNIKKEIINNINGAWFYIDTLSYNFSGNTETLKGWVFDYYLSNLNGSKRTTLPNDYKLEVYFPDHAISFIFKKNGTYIRKPFANEESKKDISGTLYQFRNLVIGKDDDNHDTISYFLFYLKNNDELCLTEGMDDCAEKLK